MELKTRNTSNPKNFLEKGGVKPPKLVKNKREVFLPERVMVQPSLMKFQKGLAKKAKGQQNRDLKKGEPLG